MLKVLRTVYFAFFFFISMFTSCRSHTYLMEMDKTSYRLKPGMEIEKVKTILSEEQFMYGKSLDGSESLQYYCIRCVGPKVRLYTLKFFKGQLSVIETKTVDSIF